MMEALRLREVSLSHELKMKRIAILGQKGGSGKTTLATALAVRAAKDGSDVAIFDLDPQGSATQWAERRGGDNPAVVSCQIFMLEKMLAKAEEGGAEWAFIDTPGKIEQAAVAAAKAADLVLIPVRATAFDLDALKELRSLLAIAGDPPSYVVVNAAPPQGRRHEDAKAVIEKMHQLQVLPAHLTQRNAFSDSIIAGQTVTEYEPQGRAAAEIDAIYSLILSITQSLKKRSQDGQAKLATAA
jgi:chromosome partitioning protein